jgi:hypothetical protein
MLRAEKDPLRAVQAKTSPCQAPKSKESFRVGSYERKSSNQSLERTAARRAFTFQMIKTVSVEAELAFGSGRSALSR